MLAVDTALRCLFGVVTGMSTKLLLTLRKSRRPGVGNGRTGAGCRVMSARDAGRGFTAGGVIAVLAVV